MNRHPLRHTSLLVALTGLSTTAVGCGGASPARSSSSVDGGQGAQTDGGSHHVGTGDGSASDVVDASASDGPTAANDTGSANPDGGHDAGCDPNVPLSATIVPISDPATAFRALAPNPTPCTDGIACTYQDLQVNYTTCAGPVEGFRFRYIRPSDANIVDPGHVPAIISEPGSGACWFGESSFDLVDETAASQGAIVLEVAPRGQFLCYLHGDALYQESDWLGPETLGDYDRLLLGFVQGWLDPKLHADPARLGIHGVSHGGLASFLYGSSTHIPAVTGKPLALVMPELGNPDLASWSVDGFDPNDLAGLLAGTASSATPWGAMRLDGLVGWEFEYPGPVFAAPYAADVLAGDDVSTWAPQFEVRSAHDDAAETSVSKFTRNVKHFLAVTATEDCIIPHQGAFDFYQQLQTAAGATDVRLLSPVSYHSCGDTVATLSSSLGYLPKVTGTNSQRMGGWASSVRSAWISRYLIGVAPLSVGSLPTPPDPGVSDPTAQPDWMFMLADEGLGATVPNVYTSSPPGALTTIAQTFVLGSGTTSINNTPISLDSATLSYDAGTDTVLNIVTPAWNEASAAEVDIDFPITTDDFVVIGQPDITLFVRETSSPAADYSFTVILEDLRPGEPAWPVSSERRFSHTSTGTLTKQEILLDTVKSRFKKGDTLRVAISNISVMIPLGGTNSGPMFAPSINSFTLAFASTLGGQSATLVLPTIPAASLVLAPPAWQIQP